MRASRTSPITGNVRGDPGASLLLNRKVPAAAHSFYFRFPADDGEHAVAHQIREALGLASTSWLRESPARGRPDHERGRRAFELRRSHAGRLR